jgi:homoserine O-acetyltransferase
MSSTSSAPAASSPAGPAAPGTPPADRAPAVPEAAREGILEWPGPFALHHGGSLPRARLAWRLVGPPAAPVVLVLGGISAHRHVASEDGGWWPALVGAGRAIDTRRFRVLGIDWLGGSGESTGPARGQADFLSVSAYDQAELVARLVAESGMGRLHAIVGASYGGMVALACAERRPAAVARIVVVSAADRTHPMSTARRCVQREIVRFAIAHGDGAAGLRLARALAMTTYRTPAEFAARFDAPAVRRDGAFRFPVEDYLFSRGDAYATRYVPEAFMCLSESIDLHRVDASRVRLPATLVAVRDDQLVPLATMQSLAQAVPGARLHVIDSIYGHDAFFKEASQLQPIFADALEGPAR